MRYNSLALGVAAVAPLVLAQTTSECDPIKGEDCPPDPAFGNCGKAQVYDFSSIEHGDGWRKDDSFRDLWKPDDGVLGDDSPLSIDDNGAIFTITKDSQAPLIKSKKYIFFGKVEVVLKAAPGVGIVTSVVLESDDRDEIDWEWVGGDQGNVQTNFFSKGVNEFIHGEKHATPFNPMEGLHTYTLEWTPDFIIFSVDGTEVRRATPAEAENGKKWPQTPTMIKLGTWVGGRPDGAEGTIEWAGGVVDMSQAPFVGWYKQITVTDYCGGKDEAGEYVYSDTSGSMESIKVDGESPDLISSGSGDDSDDDKEDEDKDEDAEGEEGDEDEDEEDSSSSTVSPSASRTSSTSDTEETGDPTDSEASEETDDPSAAVGLQVSSALAGVVFLGFLFLA